MIAGIGTDIVNVEAFCDTFYEPYDEEGNQKARDRVFTKREQEYCEGKAHPYLSFAARFAAKEAFIKAITKGSLSMGMTNIEIRNKQDGQPYIVLHGDLKEKYALFEFLVTMSHCNEYATATVVAQMKTIL
jgi:holo-[acyl-carrier protein] synthase